MLVMSAEPGVVHAQHIELRKARDGAYDETGFGGANRIGAWTYRWSWYGLVATLLTE